MAFIEGGEGNGEGGTHGERKGSFPPGEVTIGYNHKYNDKARIIQWNPHEKTCCGPRLSVNTPVSLTDGPFTTT